MRSRNCLIGNTYMIVIGRAAWIYISAFRTLDIFGGGTVACGIILFLGHMGTVGSV